MNGAYGAGPLAFQQLGEMIEKAAWISGTAIVVLGLLWVVKQWSGR